METLKKVENLKEHARNQKIAAHAAILYLIFINILYIFVIKIYYVPLLSELCLIIADLLKYISIPMFGNEYNLPLIILGIEGFYIMYLYGVINRASKRIEYFD